MTQAEKLGGLVEHALGKGFDTKKLPNGIGEQVRILRSTFQPYTLIFNHQFARALFGEGFTYLKISSGTGDGDVANGELQPRWQLHLQQAVIAEDHTDYLHTAVFGERG